MLEMLVSQYLWGSSSKGIVYDRTIFQLLQSLSKDITIDPVNNLATVSKKLSQQLEQPKSGVLFTFVCGDMAKSVEKTRALRKGAWSPEEDKKLIAYINRYGIWNWAEMAKPAGLQRSGKSCRLRWVNYLRPGIKHGNFTKEEEQTIIDLHEKLGNSAVVKHLAAGFQFLGSNSSFYKWSTIASRLPGRTDNEIKNHWHAHLRKRFKYDLNALPESEPLEPSSDETNQNSSCRIDPSPANTSRPSILESYSVISTDSLPSSSSNPPVKIEEKPNIKGSIGSLDNFKA
ncbi:hypothetical protein V6N13_084587 [Hibiscus sabdariffa]|uniref:Uncharacterized protein n=1 Tax=Hibiscus sabdariffa TaxID=183260 RepID=A0ABR2T293_9ROSI